MSALAEFYIKKETLQTILDTLNKKGEKGISLKIGINDETNQWGQNVSVSVTQSKEDREAKKDKFYVGNGKVFWTDSKISVAQKVENTGQANDSNLPIGGNSDLPF